MNNNIKKTIFLLLSILLLLQTISSVNAWGRSSLTPPASVTYGHPQLQSVHMGNGRFVYVVGSDTASNNIHIYVYDAQGTQQAYTVETGYTNYQTKGLSVIAVDDDNIIIVVAQALVNALCISLFEYNTLSYVITEYNGVATVGGLSPINYLTVSQIILYTNKTYFTVSFENLGTTFNLWLYEFDIDTSTLSETKHSGGNYAIGYTFFHQSQIAGEETIFYGIGAKDTSLTTPRFIEWDISSHTTDPKVLADGGVAGSWQYANRLSLRIIGAGEYYNTTTTKYYQYFTWSMSVVGDSSCITYQNRLRYNTSIDPAPNMEAQDLLTDTVTVNVGAPSDEIGIYSGFMDDKDTFYVFHEHKYAEPNDYRCYRLDYYITDWQNFGSSTLDVQGTADWYENIVVDGHQWIINKDPTSTWEVAQKSDNTLTYFYYDLGIDYEGYTVTWVYTPSDDPPYINTRYLFTATVTLNERVTTAVIEVYVDDSLILAEETDGGGNADWYFITNTRGVHNFTVLVYDTESTFQTSETEVYVFQDDDVDDVSSTTLGLISLQTLMYFIPAMMITIVPSLALFIITNNIVGFLGGLIVGTSIGTMAGIVPTYMALLLALVIILGFVYFVRQGGGG